MTWLRELHQAAGYTRASAPTGSPTIKEWIVATIKDVSQLANVSISTVSRVINNTAQVAPEKREAVLAAMKELNFRPNSFA